MPKEHSTRKTYNQRDLEQWLNRVSVDWENRFAPEVLAYGRKLYKTGAIVDLTLESNEANAQSRIDGEQPYCIISFENGTFHWRGSVNDPFLISSIAVAAFYEIEELLDGFLFNESFSAEEESDAQEQEIVEQTNAPASEVEKMKLVLRVSSDRRGLKLQAKWRQADGKEIPAFGKGHAENLKMEESFDIVRLATLARKSGFKYDKDCYILAEVLKIPVFLNNRFVEWEKSFEISKDKNVDILAKGERLVTLRPVAKETADSASDFDLTWEPRIGDERISDEEFKRFCKGSSSVKIIPKYGIVKVSAKDASFVREVENARTFSFEKGTIPRYMLFTLSDFGERIEMSAELNTWLKSLVEKPKDNFIEEDFLRPYQKRGIAWASRLFEHGCNALIADEMGLGKSVQSLALINRFRDSDKKKKFLVACPASVIPVWLSETKKFYPDIKCGILGAHSNIEDSELWISSYAQLRRNLQFLKDVNFELAILDEAQFIKNPDAKTTAACSAIKAKCRLALTGTPVENRLLDMWTVFNWLMPRLLGTRANFDSLVSANANDKLVKTIRKQISPFILRRMKTEVAAELPEKIYVDLACPMSEKQKSEYEKLLTQTRECLGSIDNNNTGKITVLSLLTRLRQTACDASLLPWVEEPDRGGKITVIADKVEELFQSGKKILVFSQFTKFLDIIRAALAERLGDKNIFELTGSTRDRAKPVEQFQQKTGAALMLVSLRAGGTGITLTSADYVFIADPWWNPAVEEQAIDRVHRIGRRADVFVYRLVAQGTVEQRVRELQNKKRTLFEDLLGGLRDVSANAKFAETIKDILS